MTALIVVPVFDEAETVGDVVAAARAYGPVLVVDDGSRDESAEIARRAGAEVIRHPRRRGKGAAILTGIAAARERGASSVVTLDGDGQHRPSDLGLLLDAARARRRTIVVGGRLDDAGALPPDRLNAIRVAGFFVNWACGLRLRDTQSGFRVYPIELFDDLRLHRGGFVLETEVLVAGVARGWRVHEVPVAALARARQRSRFRPISDGVAIGGYLAGRVLIRWALETGALVAAIVKPFYGERRRVRHQATLEQAAQYSGSPPLWAMSVGSSAIQHVINRVIMWRHDPRPRRALVAAQATAAAPVLLGLLVLQAFAPRRMPDVVSPLVRRLCSQDRLSSQDRLAAEQSSLTPIANPVGPPS
jgi:glycosyltransferase involved in cell wall biosynthesis